MRKGGVMGYPETLLGYVCKKMVGHGKSWKA